MGIYKIWPQAVTAKGRTLDMPALDQWTFRFLCPFFIILEVSWSFKLKHEVKWVGFVHFRLFLHNNYDTPISMDCCLPVGNISTLKSCVWLLYGYDDDDDNDAFSAQLSSWPALSISLGYVSIPEPLWKHFQSIHSLTLSCYLLSASSFIKV